MEDRSRIRLSLNLDPDSWHGTNSEGIWTKFVTATAEKAVVEVDNIPFFSRSVSLGDHLSVSFIKNKPFIDGVVERGGHSTYRIFVEERGNKETVLLDVLASKGCSWEKSSFRGGDLYALDIPPEVDIYEIYELLESGKKEKIWLFEEGFVGHPQEGSTPLKS